MTRFLIDRSTDGNEDVDPKTLALLREQDHRRLSAMVNYCKTADCLLAALKAVRTRLAREEVPTYIIFSNATLADMAAKAPRTTEQFLQVSRRGPSQDGAVFLQAISEYMESENEDAGAGGID